MAAFGVPQRARGRPRARPARRAAHAQAPGRAERGDRRALRRRARAAHRDQHRAGDGGHRRRARARRSRPATPSTRPRASSRRPSPGQVLVSERTAQAARHFRFGEPRTLELRGRTEPLRAVELLADQPITEGTLSGTRAPFVGRERELELLDDDLRARDRGGAPASRDALRRGGRRQEPARRRAAGGPRGDDARRRASPAAAVSPTATASATGRSPRCSRRSRARPTTIRPTSRARRCRARPRPCWRRPARIRPGELAAYLTASIGLAPIDLSQRSAQEVRAETHLAWRSFFSALAVAGPDGRPRRGHPVGGRRGAGAARGRREPCRRPGAPALHGAPRADGAAADLGRRAAQLHGPRGRSARLRTRARSSSRCCSTADRGSARRDRRARRGQPVLPRGDRAHAQRGAGSAGRICPTPCTPRSPRASTSCRRTRSARCRPRRSWAACSGPARVAEVAAVDSGGRRRAARPPAGSRSHPRPALVLDERPARADLQARADLRGRLREPAAARPRAHAPRRRGLDRCRRSPVAATRSSS